MKLIDPDTLNRRDQTVSGSDDSQWTEHPVELRISKPKERITYLVPWRLALSSRDNWWCM